MMDPILREMHYLSLPKSPNTFPVGGLPRVPSAQRAYYIREFKVERMLGKGSYGEVYLARSSGKVVAIKKLSKFAKGLSRDDIEKEIDAGKKLNHKNIVKYFESFEDEEHVYIIMELIEGTDLCSFYEERNLQPMTEPEVKKIFIQLVEGLIYMHLKGVVHLDLKLENILLDSQNRVKIIDFGFCDHLSSKESLSKRYVGSKEYTDPMILMKRPFNGFKADIWSLGVVLYVLLFADFPFEHKHLIEHLITKRETPPIRFPKPISKEAEHLINSMLVVDPTKRLSLKDLINHKWFGSYFKNQYRRNSV